MSPGPSAAILEGNDPNQDDSGEQATLGQGNPPNQDASDQGEGSGSEQDTSSVDENSSAAHSSSEEEMQDDTEEPRSRGLVTLSSVEDEAVGPVLPPKSMSIEDVRALESLAGRGSTFSSTRSLEDRLDMLSVNSFKAGASKVSADMVYRTAAGKF